MKLLKSLNAVTVLAGLSIALLAVPVGAANATTVPARSATFDSAVPATPGVNRVPTRVLTGGALSHGSEGGETECCTDPDPDPGGDNVPDVDVDGPGGDNEPGDGGGEDPPAGGGEDPPTGGGENDPDPGDDDLIPIWDCWENGNCDDTGDDDGPRDTGDTSDTGGGETGDTGSGPAGPIDSGPAL